MGITHKTTHVAEIEASQLQEFKESTNMTALIAVFLDKVQELENSIFDVRSAFWLDSAIGNQLDVVGDIVGIERKGLLDDPYRNAIKLQVATNVSDGTTDNLLSIFDLYGASVTWRDWYNAGIVFTGLTAATDADYLMGFLNQARSAGVKLQLVFDPVIAPASAFRFGSTVTPTTGATYTGFSATGGSVGGNLLGVY